MGADTVRTVLSRLVVLLITMGQSVILARWLQPEGRGQYATLLLIPQLMAFLAPLGIQWSIVYYLRTEPGEMPRYLSAGLGLSLAAGVIGLGMTAGLEAVLYNSLLTGLSVTSVLLASLLVPVRVLDGFLRGVFRGTDRIYMANLLIVLRPAVSLVGVGLVIVLAGAGVPGLVAVVVVTELTVMLLALVTAFQVRKLRTAIDWSAAQALLSYGLRVYFFAILLFLNYRLDMGLVRYYLTYEEVGYYVTAVTIAELLWNVPNAVGFVLFPSIAGGTRERQRELTTKTCRAVVIVMGLGCLAAGGGAYPAIGLLYGDNFLPAFWPLLWLLPGIFAMSIQQVLGADLSARGFPGKVTVAACLGLAANLGLNMILIPRFGIEGAAIASSVSYTAISAIVLVQFLKVSQASLAETLSVRGEDMRFLWGRVKHLGFTRA